MPGFTTHYLFGVKAYNDLPNNYLKHVISKYRWLYQLGLQGPDIFFYNVPILRHRDYRNVGSHMHEYQVNDFFKNSLLELTEIHSRQQKEEAAAFLAGFMCHYISDSICHPFVYGRIKYRTDKKKTECHGLHAARDDDVDLAAADQRDDLGDDALPLTGFDGHGSPWGFGFGRRSDAGRRLSGEEPLSRGRRGRRARRARAARGSGRVATSRPRPP